MFKGMSKLGCFKLGSGDCAGLQGIQLGENIQNVFREDMGKFT